MNSETLTNLDPDVYKTIVFFIVLFLAMRFILSVVKRLLNHKLKSRIIEKGLSEEFLTSIFKTEKINEKSDNIKWFLILFLFGIGLFIVANFQPIGIHSIAIIIISISMGFLAHYYYLRTYKK